MVGTISSEGEHLIPDLYHSLPLPSDSRYIRLLDIYPLSGSEGTEGHISGHLRVVDLDAETAPSFTALTYVFGTDADPIHWVACGSYQLPVRENCYSALAHLREELGYFTVWVDAICIHQDDTDEKMRQISLLGAIFSKAEKVYVWLGKGNQSTDRAMTYMKTFQLNMKHYADPVPEGKTPSNSRVWRALWSSYAGRWGLTRYPSPSLTRGSYRLSQILRLNTSYVSYDDLGELLDREWIKRIWTYQEILLASDPIVVCGNHHLPWHQLEMSIIYLEFSGLNYRDDKPILPVLQTWAKVIMCRDQLHFLHASSSPDDYRVENLENRPTRMRRYQQFVLNVSRKAVSLRHLTETLLFITAVALFYASIPGFISIITAGHLEAIKPITSSVIDHASNAAFHAERCAIACKNLDSIKCGDECSKASKLLSYVEKNVYTGVRNKGLSTFEIVMISVEGSLLVLTLVIYFCLWVLLRSKPILVPILHPQGSKMDLANGLCNRRSLQEKDKAFAVHAVLQRLLDRALPVPDSSRSLELIYHELTLRLIAATGSLQVLLPAALENFPGHPSWVPNWAAEFDTFWLRAAVKKGVSLNATPCSRSHWKWNSENPQYLSVRGCQLEAITQRYILEETSEYYDSAEEGSHLANFRAMQECWKVKDLSMYWHSAGDVTMILGTNTAGLCDQIDRHHLRLWSIFFLIVREKDPEVVLKRLTNKSSTSFFWFALWHVCRERLDPNVRIATGLLRDITREGMRFTLGDVLNTQIAICNTLARRRCMLFLTPGLSLSPYGLAERIDRRWDEYLLAEEQRTPSTQSMVKKTIGICRDNVRVGDRVVLIAGVHTPLIIRHQRDYVRLVSPASIEGIMNGERWDQNWEAEDLEEFILC